MVKFKRSHVGPLKPLLPSSETLIFTLFVTFTFLLIFLILLSLRIPIPTNNLNSISHNTVRSKDGAREHWVEIISWEPRLFLYHNFLTQFNFLNKPKSDTTQLKTKEECEHLINIAKPSMHKSTVIDRETGKNVESSVRTSSGTFIMRGDDKILSNIEKRIADFTFIPIENGEDVNILHYEVGQKYVTHSDYFSNEISTRNGGQRTGTMLMYLSNVEEGGETTFPFAKGNFSSVSWWNKLSDCGKKGLSIRPKMGDAILFWNMKPDGTFDPSSVHGACPVIKGDKWSCTKWLRVGKYV